MRINVDIEIRRGAALQEEFCRVNVGRTLLQQ